MSCSLTDEAECIFEDSELLDINSISTRNIELESYNNLSLLKSEDTVDYQSYYIWLEAKPTYSSSSTISSASSDCGSAVPRLSGEIEEILIESLVSINDSLPTGSRIDSYFQYLTRDNELKPLSNLKELNQLFSNDYHLFLRNSIQLNSGQTIAYSIQVTFKYQKKFKSNTDLVFVVQ
jgi:hypothetical protein